MSELKLYEMAESLNKIEEMAEDDMSLVTYLESVQMEVKQKVNNVIRFRRTMELTSGAIENEIERLEALKKSYDNKAENLKKYLAFCLKKLGKDKFETEVAKLSFRKSSSVLLAENFENILNPKYLRETVKVTADKKKIKEDIENGIEVDGAIVETKENLIIK